MVCTPIIHDRVRITERPLAAAIRDEPGGGPGFVGPFVERIVHFARQLHRLAFGNLQGRADAFDNVQPRHRDRHPAARPQPGRVTAAPEIFKNGVAPLGGCQTFTGVFGGDLPPRLDRGLAIDFLRTGGVQRRGAAVDQMEHTGSRLPGELVAGHAVDCLRGPIRPHIRKDLRAAGQEVAE